MTLDGKRILYLIGQMIGEKERRSMESFEVELQRVIDQLQVVTLGVDGLHIVSPPGDNGRAIAIARTHIQTAVLWLKSIESETK